MKKLKFTDLLITIMLGVVFGITMKFWDDLYTVIKPMLPVARQLIYGMWFMVGVFAMLLIRKPGAAFVNQVPLCFRVLPRQGYRLLLGMELRF